MIPASYFAQERNSLFVLEFKVIPLEKQWTDGQCTVQGCQAARKHYVLCGSDNLIPESPDTAYSCGKHGQVTAWFMSARPGNVIPVPKIYTFFEGV